MLGPAGDWEIVVGMGEDILMKRKWPIEDSIFDECLTNFVKYNLDAIKKLSEDSSDFQMKAEFSIPPKSVSSDETYSNSMIKCDIFLKKENGKLTLYKLENIELEYDTLLFDKLKVRGKEKRDKEGNIIVKYVNKNKFYIVK